MIIFRFFGDLVKQPNYAYHTYWGKNQKPLHELGTLTKLMVFAIERFHCNMFRLVTQIATG